MLGTTTIPYARVIARAHLVSLWFWSGLNKALSVGFMGGSARWLYNAFPVHLGFIEPYFGWLVIATEMSIGVLLLVPRLRRAGVVLAVGLHVSGLIALVSIRWNPSVWPWNIALALAAPAYFLFEDKHPLPRRTSVAVAIATALAIVPAGFYAGVVDAYPAHNLYTSNTATAMICKASASCSDAAFRTTWNDLNVPLPPEPRLYRAFFERVCTPGVDTLVIYPRQTRIVFGLETSASIEACP
jgi:uncharacterized membrane protein YphA (DoxX/SURF4 family)